MKQHSHDAKYTIVDVAEARGRALFGVMQPTHPVDNDIVVSFGQDLGCHDGGACYETAEFEEAWENWQIRGQSQSVCGLQFEETGS